MSKRATQHNFAMSPQNQIPRSSFKRSHTVKTTLDAGRLVPFYIDISIHAPVKGATAFKLAQSLSALSSIILRTD